MPYKNEYATNHANQEAMAQTQAGELLQSFKLKTNLIPYERLDKVFVHDFKYENINIKKVLIIDGSKYETIVDKKYSSKLALFNINQACIEIPQLQQYLRNDFPSPQDFALINKNHALQVILPTEGFSNDDYPNEADFFRYSLFKALQIATNPLVDSMDMPYKETLLGTYTHLFSRIGKTQLKMQACPECNRLKHYMNVKDFRGENDQIKWQINCKCEAKKELYLTDWLSVHLQLGNEISNEALTTQVMLILEKLVLVNLLRNLALNQKNDILNNSIFVLDGPMAIYSYASWLSRHIHEELVELSQHNNIIVIGIEKSGSFVEHAKKVETFFTEPPIKPKAIYAFNDSYIKQHIRTYDNDSYYGEVTHFGKKIYYKNSSNSSFILNLAFASDEDKEVLYNQRDSLEYIKSIKGLEQIVWMLDSFSSQSYDNAFSLLSFAHNGAALSTSELGQKLLNEFLQSIINSP